MRALNINAADLPIDSIRIHTTFLHQKFHSFDVPLAGGDMQRRPVIVVPLTHVYPREILPER